MGISNVISLFSGIALFLFGMALMGDGLKQVAGNKLELILYRLTGSPVKGFLLGTGVTAVIQSSSATSVMVVGFVNSGMMKVRQSISIVLGAILGTSITGWIICLSDIGSTGGWMDLFSTATLTGVISVIGIVLRMASKDPAKKHIGDILMGFAVLMFGMSTMSAAVSPLREDPTFIRILTSFSNPFLGILFGTLFTCVLQSASAAVGILQALASTGIIDFSIALPIIMGIAIGAAMPVLLSAIGASVDGKRTAMVYLVAEVTGVIFFAAIYYCLDALIRFPFADRIMTSVSIAFANTVFRFIKVVTLLPFTRQIEKVVDLLVPDKPQQKPVEPEAVRLEERFIQHPALAIEQSRLTINAMAEEAAELCRGRCPAAWLLRRTL
ncbi:MAG: Na/Pi cotransporter family protein [Oscillospiraceae bacterium]